MVDPAVVVATITPIKERVEFLRGYLCGDGCNEDADKNRAADCVAKMHRH
jgi:hypothetical protein